MVAFVTAMNFHEI